jgi:hypothetical protein
MKISRRAIAHSLAVPAGLLALLLLSSRFAAASQNPTSTVERFNKEIRPILVEYCYDCHGEGMDKGKVAFDAFKTDEELIGRKELWQAVLKNVRAGLMPPEKKPRPSAAQQSALERWIKYEAFGLDPLDPDPGRVTVRRLNRLEYKNTIRDLTGHDFKVEDELPPDDTGYGFDNIGEVLTVSPLLLEKYMQAAETIVASAVPRVTRMVAERFFPGTAFRNDGAKERGKDRFSFYDETLLHHPITVEKAGTYRLTLELEVFGEFIFDPGRCRVSLKAGDRSLVETELGWQNGKKFSYDAEEIWPAGPQSLTVEVHPLTPVDQKKNSLTLRVAGVRLRGPTEREHWARPKNFELFFTKDPPEQPAERAVYAREVLARFVRRAYRRPVDDKTVDKLVQIAEATYSRPGKKFEDGIAQALIPVLASPRFLFRIEGEGQPAGKANRFVDEYSLASRLSYFLWATMPDAELMRLAERGALRRNLAAQARRMLADERSREFVDSFVGQWLQVRDVEGIDINSRVILSRDAAQDRELQRNRQRFRELRDIPDEKLTPEQQKELDEFRRRFGERPQVELDRDLRRALRLESEMLLSHILKQDRSVLELLDCNYTFLNERLAKHYGITNIVGGEMRRVDLPPDSPRGGVLGHGSVLIVTSNPTRTSPVKRGLFILDNILGTPPPPPPANVPPLENSEKENEGRTPTLRETLAVHRENTLCRSCHNRMDPLGLALENFNALGMWRTKERGQPIDSTGKLITGEPFNDIRELKKILVTDRRLDFYRCLTEKLLTYALGRGLQYTDVETVDRIVADLEKNGGKISALLMGVVESAPFQKRRNDSVSKADKNERQTTGDQVKL